MSQEQEALASQMLAGVRSELYAASFKVSATFSSSLSLPTWLGGDPDAKDVALEALTSYGKILDTVEQQLDLVRGGAESFEAWSKRVADIRKNIAEIAQDTSEWSFAGVLGRTVEKTATEAKETAKEVAAKATEGISAGLGALVFVVGAFVLYKVLK